MIHLKIEQNNSATEQVSGAVIEKLYEIVNNNELDLGSSLVGLLHTTATKQKYIDLLTTEYADLHINADKAYLSFEDPIVESVLATKWGDGIGLTNNDLTNRTSIPSSLFNDYRTLIVSFNELGDFTGINRLETWAFSGCTNLESIDLSNIEYFGGEALLNTKITGTLNLPKVIQLGDSTRGRALSENLFITQVNFGPNLTDVWDSAFLSCSALQRVTGLNNMNKTSMSLNRLNVIPISMFSFDGNLVSTDIDYSYITSVWLWAFNQCYKLEDTIDLTNITRVGTRSFNGCKKVDFVGTTANLIVRGENSFCLCNLSNVTVFINCNSTEGKGEYCFSEATLPATITIGSECTMIKNNEFRSTLGLRLIFGGNNITSIGINSFYGSSIEDISLSNVTLISSSAFKLSSLKTASFPSVETINGNSLQLCNSLTTFTGGNSLQTIGNESFAKDISLTSFSPFTSLVSIGSSAFILCPLTNTSVVSLPNCTFIGENAFGESGITSVTANALTTINKSTFAKCRNLSSILFNNVTEIKLQAFLESKGTFIVNFPSLTTMGTNVFTSCINITTVSDLGSITTLPQNTFYGCSSLNSITLPSTLTSIETNAFRSCKSLTSISIPDAVTSIGDNAFAGDSSLTTITIGTGILEMIYPFTNGVGSQVGGFTLTVKATTPPTLNLSGSNITAPNTIYVPAASVSAYQNAAGWSTYANKILAITT